MYFLSLATSVTCRAMQFHTILLLSILNSAYFISILQFSVYFNSAYFNTPHIKSPYTSILPTFNSVYYPTYLHSPQLLSLVKQFCQMLCSCQFVLNKCYNYDALHTQPWSDMSVLANLFEVCWNGSLILLNLGLHEVILNAHDVYIEFESWCGQYQSWAINANKAANIK